MSSVALMSLLVHFVVPLHEPAMIAAPTPSIDCYIDTSSLSSTLTKQNNYHETAAMSKQPRTLAGVPRDIRLCIYDHLIRQTEPIATRHDQQPNQLLHLIATRLTCRTLHQDLPLSQLSILKAAFYQSNTLLFASAEDLVDFIANKPQSILDNTCSVIIDDSRPKKNFLVFRSAALERSQALAHLHYLRSLRIVVGNPSYRKVAMESVELTTRVWQAQGLASNWFCHKLSRLGICSGPVVVAFGGCGERGSLTGRSRLRWRWRWLSKRVRLELGIGSESIRR